MSILPIFIAKATKLLLHTVREIAYDDMSRQASGWIPEEARIERTVINDQPIKLDFNIPKKNRLNWIRRTMHHLPH